MGQVVALPACKGTDHYENRLQTEGGKWTEMEKKIIDRAEFLEAMIVVLDDVKMTNIQNRDYAMMEIITEEIERYQKRLDEEQKNLSQLRQQYHASEQCIIN